MFLQFGERFLLNQQGGEITLVGGEHDDVVGGPSCARTAQRGHCGGQAAQHLARRNVLQPHHVEHALIGEARKIKIERLRRVEIIFGKHVGRARRAAIGIDAGQLQHVELARSGRQIMTTLGLYEVDPGIGHAGPEVIPIRLRQYFYRGRIDFHCGDFRRLEIKRRENVEAAAHANRRHPRVPDASGLVSRRVNGLIDAGERFRIAVVLHCKGEGKIILSDDPFEPFEKGRIISDQDWIRDVLRIRWRNPRHFNSGDGVPGYMFEEIAASGLLRGRQN